MPVAQLRQPAPPPPHALFAVPPRHCPAEQHPEHDDASHAHSPATQWSPVVQVPASHTPPQPSSCPQAAPAQLGAQPQRPAATAPHIRGLAQSPPAQHDWPWPPHVPQLPAPHVDPLQHPEHEAASHTQSPLTQCWPLPQVPPPSHTPPQPSSAPHALPVHVGVQPQSPV